MKTRFCLVLILLFSLSGCDDKSWDCSVQKIICNPKEATKALEDAGFQDIKITGIHWFACSDDDFYNTGFEATNINGRKITGTVCSGLFFKNSTIRFD